MAHENYIRIEQTYKYKPRWAVIHLTDTDSPQAMPVKGTWVHTNISYLGGDKEVHFTDDNPEYYYFKYEGNAAGGDLVIGTKIGDYDDVLMRLSFAKRSPGGEFRVGSTLGTGVGKLSHARDPHFGAGDIVWLACGCAP